jgi:hypothetical protein
VSARAPASLKFASLSLGLSPCREEALDGASDGLAIRGRGAAVRIVVLDAHAAVWAIDGQSDRLDVRGRAGST